MGRTRQCRHCERRLYGRSPTCRSRTCPGYSHIWAGDQRLKIFRNLEAYADGDTTCVMPTVTAPGADVLPWDEDFCAPLGPHEHSGALGCRVDLERAREWNATCSERWRKLHDAAQRATERDTGRRAWMLERAHEKQIRGMLHVHPVFAFGTARQKHETTVYVGHLARLAPAHGFGFVDRKLRPRPAREAAAYLSSYFCTGKGRKKTLRQTVLSEEMPRSILYTSVKLTQRTGCTMRSLRFRRFVWIRWNVTLDFPTLTTVQTLVREFDAELLPNPPPALL